jgi:hypothetical protein
MIVTNVIIITILKNCNYLHYSMTKNCGCKYIEGGCGCSFDLSPMVGMNENPKCIYCEHIADAKKKDFSYVTDDGNEMKCFN